MQHGDGAIKFLLPAGRSRDRKLHGAHVVGGSLACSPISLVGREPRAADGVQGKDHDGA
jgi:hypothetical protein